MYSELSLNRMHQKTYVKIIGGGENVIYTSVPVIQGQAILLSKNKSFDIHIFNEEYLFKFETFFKGITKENNDFFYTFEVIKTFIDNNKRKEKREIVDLPLIIELSEEISFMGRALDLSKTGAKIFSTKPITTEFISLHLQTKNGIKKFPCKVSWGMPYENAYYYGVQFEPA